MKDSGILYTQKESLVCLARNNQRKEYQMNTAFQQRIKENFGENGERWLSELPSLIEYYCNLWNLTVEQEVPNLSYNYVLFVKRADEQAVLKLSVPSPAARHEIKATSLYRGTHFVRLLTTDESAGVQLLERLSPGKPLAGVEEERAIEIYCLIWRSLRRPAVKGFPHMKDWFQTLTSHNGPVTSDYLQKANQYAEEIFANGQDELLHGDLHHANILYDEERGWCGIDPKGVIGDRTFDCAAFLLNESPSKELLIHRLQQLSHKLDINEERLRKATISLLTVQACWATEDDGDWKAMIQKIDWLT